jgi:hypothetical protein
LQVSKEKHSDIFVAAMEGNHRNKYHTVRSAATVIWLRTCGSDNNDYIVKSIEDNCQTSLCSDENARAWKTLRAKATWKLSSKGIIICWFYNCRYILMYHVSMVPL